MIDELQLHRYMEGRLQDAERARVEETLRSDPAARRQLDGLREESRLLRGTLETLEEPTHRLSDKVLADLHLEERDRLARLNRGRMFRWVGRTAAFAAAVAICFWLIGPRDPAAVVLSGSKATVTAHGDSRTVAKGGRIYDDDELRTGPGQFLRIKLAQGAVLDVDENSRLIFQRSGLGLSVGRMGIDSSESTGEVHVGLIYAQVTQAPQSKCDVWVLPRRPIVWPKLLFTEKEVVADETEIAEPLDDKARASMLTVLEGSATFAYDIQLHQHRILTRGQRIVRSGEDAEVIESTVNLTGSHVLELRPAESIHSHDDALVPPWVRIGLLSPPQFEALGRRWGLVENAPAQIAEALRALDVAFKIAAPKARAEALTTADQALHQACESLPQDDPRKPFGLTLEGLAHCEEARAQQADATAGPADAWTSFNAARVSFEGALAPRKTADGAPDLSGEAAWKAAFAANGPVELDSLAPVAQSALLAKFRHAVVLYGGARSAPEAKNRLTAARAAVDEFVMLHEELGRSVEGSAALLAQAFSEELGDDQNGVRQATNSLHALAARPLAGSSGVARAELEGVRQAALVALVRLNALDKTASHVADKTLNAAHDFALLYPLNNGSHASAGVRTSLNSGLETLARTALNEKRFDAAVEALDAQLTALEESDRRERPSTSIPGASSPLQHVTVHLDLAEALAGAQDWARLAREVGALEGQVPDEFAPRFEALKRRLQDATKK